MAAPTPAATPHAPAGIVIQNGHPTIFTIELNDTLAVWEVDVTPPGIDGGDANDLTNMHNTDWRTYAARTLKQLTEASATCQMAPEVFDEMVEAVNVETTVTIHMPGGAKLAFYGYVRTWTPEAFVEGEPPTGALTIQPTNRDPETGDEEAPVLLLPEDSGVSGFASVRGARKAIKGRKTVDVFRKAKKAKATPAKSTAIKSTRKRGKYEKVEMANAS